MVTAEAAMVLPVLVCLTVALVWVLMLGAGQVRCVDAAREAARLVARGEDPAVVEAAVDRLAPGDPAWTLDSVGGLVVVRVTTQVRPPLPLLGEPTAVGLSAEAAAAEEPP